MLFKYVCLCALYIYVKTLINTLLKTKGLPTSDWELFLAHVSQFNKLLSFVVASFFYTGCVNGEGSVNVGTSKENK